MDDVRLSMVCMKSRIGCIRDNLETIGSYIGKAVDNESDIVCFPEMALTGYAMPQSSYETVSVTSPEVAEIVDLTGESGICACFGFAEMGGFITHAVVENGRLLGKYRKTHLGEREAAAMRPGNTLPVFRTSKATIAVQICWESHFPEITTTYALKGADIVLMPHASGLDPEKRRSGWDRVLPARAYDNTVYVASCNLVGSNGKGTVFGGGTAVFDPRGRLMAENYDGECMLTADLEGGILETLRSPGYRRMSELYFLDKRRPELYFR